MFWKGISQGISTAEMRLELLILKWIFEKSTYKLAQDECYPDVTLHQRAQWARKLCEDWSWFDLSLSLSVSRGKQWPLTKIFAIRTTMTFSCTLHLFWALLLYLINAIKSPLTILETIPANTRRLSNVTI